MNRLIKVSNLTKSYGNKLAVNKLSFSVKEGEIYGLLGPNGAGKTTTVRCIMGIIDHDAGDIKVFGKDPRSNPVEVKRRIGYLPEDVILYETLSPREFLDFIGSIRRLTKEDYEPRLRQLVDAFGLSSYYDTTIAALSHGTKQKVAIIAALIHEPALLVLDEPFSGIDARSARIFKDLMRVHVEKGGGILFSTHIMEVAERICDKIGIINNGVLVAEGSVNSLRKMIDEAGASLEDIFLKITEQEENVADTISQIRKAFDHDTK
ncbi:MAG: ABC transporter ATP-binding protein [Candidatus Ranarchaeia archaeon]